MELAGIFFQIMRELVRILGLSPRAFPRLRRSRFRHWFFPAALFVYVAAMFTAIGLTVLWFAGFRPGG